jgi:hypothetical protein
MHTQTTTEECEASGETEEAEEEEEERRRMEEYKEEEEEEKGSLAGWGEGKRRFAER